MIKHQQEGNFPQSQVSFINDQSLPVLIVLIYLSAFSIKKPIDLLTKNMLMTIFVTRNMSPTAFQPPIFVISGKFECKSLQDDSFGASYQLPRVQFILFAIYIPSNS